MMTDSAADSKFRNQEYLQVNGAQGVIKKGQRIVDRGEIITPQIYTNLNTYMELLNKTNNSQNDHRYFYAGQFLFILICFSILYLFMGLYRSRFFNSLRKMTFLMCFITLFVVFSILMFEYVPNGIYFVPFASVPVVILVFFDSRTAIFSPACHGAHIIIGCRIPLPVHFHGADRRIAGGIQHTSSQPAVAAAHSRLHLSGILSDLFCIESHNRRQS